MIFLRDRAWTHTHRHSLGSMLDVSHVVSLSYYLVICVALRWIYLVLTQFWWMERGSKPELVYKSGSKHVQRVVQACSTLRERYEAKYQLMSTNSLSLFLMRYLASVPS